MSKERSGRRPFVRALLKDATAPAHERLHAHPGLNAAAAGAISAQDYRSLLSRLLGFHRPFEKLIRSAAERHCVSLDFEARARARLLARDLAALGVGAAEIEGTPEWPASFAIPGRGAVLGCLYVVEGSALGGRVIARALAGRFGEGVEGRRFFNGDEGGQGQRWASLMTLIEDLSPDPLACDDAVSASVRTFAEFEAWMQNWSGEGHPLAVSSA